MHPVKYLFEDIYRNHWGISDDDAKVRERRTRPLRWLKRRDESRRWR